MPIHKNINKDFFKTWTPNMAYIAGFFAADGYMTRNRRGGCFWGIEIADKDILEAIRREIGSGHKIGMRPKNEGEKQLYRLQIGSKEMYGDLALLGFTDAKSRRLAVPQVPAAHLRDFVRGYFDGDGCVWSGRIHKDRAKSLLTIRTIFTSCSKGFLSEIRRRLRLFFIFNGVLSRGEGNYYRLTYSARDSLKLYDFMYNHPILDSRDICLERKRSIFEKYLAMRP